MIGYYPSPYMKYCWKFFTPLACAVSKSMLKLRRQSQDWTGRLNSSVLTEVYTIHWCFLYVSSSSTGNTSFLSDQVHPSEIQQHLPVPLVGPRHWNIFCSLFSTPGSSDASLLYGSNRRNNDTGTFLYWWHSIPRSSLRLTAKDDNNR